MSLFFAIRGLVILAAVDVYLQIVSCYVNALFCLYLAAAVTISPNPCIIPLTALARKPRVLLQNVGCRPAKLATNVRCRRSCGLWCLATPRHRCVRDPTFLSQRALLGWFEHWSRPRNLALIRYMKSVAESTAARSDQAMPGHQTADAACKTLSRYLLLSRRGTC